MTKIFSIVAATDFSPGSSAAVERAVQLAVAHGASLRLLHAFDVSAWYRLKAVFDPQRLRQPCRRDGAGHQPGRRHASADRWAARHAAAARARQAGPAPCAG